MPPSSERQRGFIYAQADKGVKWARDYVAKGHAKSLKKKKRKKT